LRGRAAFADKATLDFKLVGIPVGSASTAITGGKGELDTGAVRYIAAGNVGAKITLSSKGKPLGEAEFPAKVKRPFFLTAMGIGSLLIILAGIAYLESSIRPLRRGRRRSLSYIGCALSLAVVAVGAAFLLAALGVANPTVPGLIALAAGAALAGGALAEVVRRRSLRKGVKRAIRRAETALAPS
jgi:serine/threonine-protein kinase